jgi:uncharacterized protein YjbI with pentapeptide repeats
LRGADLRGANLTGAQICSRVNGVRQCSAVSAAVLRDKSGSNLDGAIGP